VFKIDCVPRTVKLPVMVALVETVRAPVTASVEPSNVRFALSSSSPEVPAITTLLSVKSETIAVSATNASIFAVPSIYKSFHSNPEAPISLVPSASGKIFPVNVAPAPTISPPLIVPTPATARLPFA